MGTNFYLCHIPTEKEYQQMQELLTNKQLKDLQEVITNSTRRYHIGKRSCGWAFGFQAKEEPRMYWEDNEANVPWETNLESLKEWLNNPEYVIKDEYGDAYTSEQFWNEEVGESLKVHGDRYMSHEIYFKYHPEERRYSDTNEKVIDNIRWINCWFG